MPNHLVLVPGFEPGSKAREAFMMGHYTIRATGSPIVTRIYSERVVLGFIFIKNESENQGAVSRFISFTFNNQSTSFLHIVTLIS